MVDYKEQVFIIDIKANIHCSICYISSKEKRMSNLVMEVTDPSVNIDSASTTTQ